jgi:hypothetical protein
MWKKVAAAGAVGATIVGVGTAALATQPVSSAGTPIASSADATAAGGAKGQLRAGVRQKILAGLKKSIHGEFVTKADDGTFVTHQVYRGEVTSASATSIAVKAVDGASLTYVVGPDTKVLVRDGGKPHNGTIGDVKVGDKVLVAGTGTGTPTADYVLDNKG